MLTKKRLYYIVLIICVAITQVFSLSFAYGAVGDDPSAIKVYIEEGGNKTLINSFSVIGDADASEKLNKEALSKAKNLEAGQTLIIEVPAGEYYLYHNLFIYSNTKLVLKDNAKMISCDPEGNAGHQGSMIKSAHFRDGKTGDNAERCQKEDTAHLKDNNYKCSICNPKGVANPVGDYKLIKNIEISGGEWDANGGRDADTTAILVRHGDGITLKNTKIYNFTNHAVNISGSKNVTVEGVSFSNAQKYSFHPENESFWPLNSYNEDQKRERYRWLEALHFDFCSAEAESGAWPKDNAPPINITVKNCTFNKVYSGIGTHHTNTKKASNIVIDSCKFTNFINGTVVNAKEDEHGWPVMYMSVNDFEMKNCGTDNNPVEYANDLVYLNESTNVKIHHNVAKKTHRYGICFENSTGEIYNNKILDSKENGILLRKTSVGTIKNNEIQDAGKRATGEYASSMAAIKVMENSTATISNNTKIISPKNGIWVNGSTVTASNNTITNPTVRGIVLYDKSTSTNISGNTISDSTQDGILINKGSVATIKNNIIKNAGKKATGDSADAMAAIKVLDNSTATISSNTEITSPRNGIVVNSSKVIISKNTISNPTNNGMSLASLKAGSSVTSNTINTPTKTGIYAGSSAAQLAISENTINSSGSGIVLSSMTNANNTIKNNTITSAKNRGIVLGDNSKSVEISGNKISDSTEDGILINKGSVATIKNNVIKNAGKKATGASADAMAAIKVLENSTATISGNTEIISPRNGIVVNSSKVIASGNTITTPSVNGVSLISPKAGSSVTSNTIKTPTKTGIYAESSAGQLTISGNNINSPGNGIMLSNMTNANNAIKNNTITSAKSHGILVGTYDDKTKVSNPAKAIVTANTVNSPGATGILVTGGSTATVDSNIIDKAGEAAVNVSLNSVATIKNNTKITSPKNGIIVDKAKAVITGNTISGPKNNGITVLSAKDGSSVTSNTVTSPAGIGIYTEKSKLAISKNKVTDAVNDGIFATNSSVRIEGNTTNNAPRSTKGEEKDIRLLNAKSGSTLKNNKYGTRGFLVKDSYATGGGNTSIYAKVSGLSNKTYTGSAITQNPVVKIVGNGVTITPEKGRDYTVSFKNNVNAGTATVVLKDPAPFVGGKGVIYYPIETTSTFTIAPSTHTHSWDAGTITKQPTTTATGVRTYTCKGCKQTKTETVPKLTESIRRVFGEDRYLTALAIAETYMKETGQQKLNSIIVACATNFPDALAGSYLANAKKAPIIIWHDSRNAMIQTFIKQKVKSGGTVYILGGTSAVGDSIKKNMGAYKFVRLADSNRYGTDLKILNAVGIKNAELLVCDATEAGKGINALIASATGKPILLVAKGGLLPIQKTWLSQNKSKITKITIIGNANSVDTNVEQQLKAYGTVSRIGGKNGDEVSANVGKTYFKDAKEIFIATMDNYPDGLCGGPLAISAKGPIILVNGSVNASSVNYCKTLSNLQKATVFGGDKAMPDAIARKVAKNTKATMTKFEKKV